MVRKQIYIGADQERALKSSARYRAGEADVVRHALERDLSKDGQESKMTKEQALVYLRARAVEIAKRARAMPHRERDWTRDDAYEED